jgi:hypothetical protein
MVVSNIYFEMSAFMHLNKSLWTKVEGHSIFAYTYFTITYCFLFFKHTRGWIHNLMHARQVLHRLFIVFIETSERLLLFNSKDFISTVIYKLLLKDLFPIYSPFVSEFQI